MDREDVFKTTTSSELFYEINDDNGLKTIPYTKSRIIFGVLYSQIAIYNKADGHLLLETRSRTGDLLPNRERNQLRLMFDFQKSRLVVAKVGAVLSLSNRATQKSDPEGFNVKELNEMEGKQQFQVRNSNEFSET